ncbi:MAG: glycosyltransferase family 10 domain-containing protein, partial [Candidatus Heimdallarchaeaceae archaeon]
MNIAFTDFWDMFVPTHNFFYYLFKDIYGPLTVTTPTEADILFYGPYTQQHKAHSPKDKIKIFVTGENVRPNFEECTYSFTFDFEDYGGRNIRLPLWFLQFDWYDTKGFVNPEFVMPFDKIDDNEYIRTPKTKFCVLVNNNLFDNRIECVKSLRKYKPVECYGKPFGNWFYGESKKYEIYSHYKFSVCFENSFAPTGGYYTEKLIHSKLAGTIPLYYADEKVSIDFNTESFLNLNDYESMDH